MKNKKIAYVIVILLGLGMLVAGLVMKYVVRLSDSSYTTMLIVCGAVELVACTVSLVMQIRKEKKENGTSPAVKSGKELNVPPLADDAEILIEKDGKDLYEIFNKGEEVSQVSLLSDDGIYTYDYLWYKNYGEHAFCVLGSQEQDEDGNPQYMKYIFRLVDSGDGEATGLVFEEDEGVRDVIIEDFAAAAESYAKGQSVPTGTSMGVKYEDKNRVKSFVALTAVYLTVLLVGLIGFFTGFGIKDVQQLAICKAITLAYAVITPSYFIYLGASNPFNFGNVICKALIVAGIAAMIVLSCVSLTALPEGIEFDGFRGFFMHIFMPAVPFVATFCYFAVYCWWCKNAPSTVYLGFGIAVTLLFPVATALLIAFFILAFIIGAIKWILSSLGVIAGDTNLGKGFISGLTGKSFEKTYTITDEHGYEHTVKSSDGIHFYGDGASYISDDGGHTIRRA